MAYVRACCIMSVASRHRSVAVCVCCMVVCVCCMVVACSAVDTSMQPRHLARAIPLVG